MKNKTKRAKKISIDEERYNQLIHAENEYKILSHLLVLTSFIDQNTDKISFDNERLLKILDVVNEELYAKIINKSKEEKE